MKNSAENKVIAALDLGSNSFHMIIAHVRDNHFQVVDKLREMVQLRAGLDTDKNLNPEAQQRALDCLERFGQRIGKLPEDCVRVVGTNTLRIARDSSQFLAAASKAIGHPIQVIAGEEEARLIYLGVSNSLSFDNKRRLVIDIGGGSTEFIIGEGVEGRVRESLEMGCVSFSQRYFSDGNIHKKAMRTAIIAAATRLRSIQKNYRELGWTEVVGASGTIRCVAKIVEQQGWSSNGIITKDSLTQLCNLMDGAGHIDQLTVNGLNDKRLLVLPGGVAVLRACFEQLKIDKLTVSKGALREGLLYDLLGRIGNDDERDKTVLAMAKRYHRDAQQAERVTKLVKQLFEQVAKDWALTKKQLQQLLWACQLHEIGLSIAHDQYHEHSYYLIANASLLGFSREEQFQLAVMVRGQRRRFPTKYMARLPTSSQTGIRYLTILLRLALVFNRGRSVTETTPVKMRVNQDKISLSLPIGWLAEHPLTEADLQQEIRYLARVDLTLELLEQD